jgi:predicted site-specific integrase-resolvase
MTFKVEPVSGVHIGKAAERLGVTAVYLRRLERQGLIPAARRDVFGRIYSEFDIALLRSMGVGSRPHKLKRAEEVVG